MQLCDWGNPSVFVACLFPDAGDKLQTIEIASLTSDFTLAVKDVDAVIHCATPSYLQGATNKETLDVSSLLNRRGMMLIFLM